jgi:hypothetical protein
MQFPPKTRDEIEKERTSFAPFPKGWYDFEVMQAEDTTSKAGNDMIKLKLRVFGDTGGERHVYDYLLESLATKLFDFCEAVGLVDKYDAGTLTADDCLGRTARVKLDVEDKPGYAAKNIVKDYGRVKDIGQAPAPKQKDDDGDEIPF